MCKQLIFAALVLFFPGWLEGNGMKAPHFLHTTESVLVENSLPFIIEPRATSLDYLNIFEMIRGRVPGVLVTGSNNNYQIRIRGSARPPLVVLDGMPFYGYNDQNINLLLGAIQPADVDYIELIKGISEAAIYGPGAGNGVIIIHTKPGEQDDLRDGKMQ